MNYIDKINNAVHYIKSKIDIAPEIGIILGTGLGSLGEHIDNKFIINYNEIPDFPISTVIGHAGRFIFGTLESKNVMAMQGRFHFYEGYSMQDVTLPIRIMKSLGVEILIVSNACGGLNDSFHPGDIMIIKDHINLMGTNPLIGQNLDEFGPRFPDMSDAYDKNLIELCEKVSSNHGIIVKSGVYTGITGPYYFSKAELQMLIILGSDAIGMSTVPEVIVARHCGMRTLGLSCITDMAIPDTLVSISHEQVLKIAEAAKPNFIKLVKAFVAEV